MSKIPIGGTLIWYFYICPRQVWLIQHQLTPDQENKFIEIGRFLAESSYPREVKEVNLEGCRFDILSQHEGAMVVAEVKKSSAHLKSATMQLAEYLAVLEKRGLKAKGEIRIPKEKKKIEICLDQSIKEELDQAKREIEAILSRERPPLPQRGKFCRNCGYLEFCWA